MSGDLFLRGGGAKLSPCEQYRFLLWRTWDRRLPSVCFIGLNPSTADAEQDDPTIRRCLRFARDWGCGQLVVVNLFAYRATKPRDLWMAYDPIGFKNDEYLLGSANVCSMVVAAWGANAFPAKLRREDAVRKLLAQHQLHHLGLSQTGHPRHPLYLRADTRPEIWR